MIFAPSARSTVTLRTSVVMSGFTTNTNWPLGPVCTACEGTINASFWSNSLRLTVTNWPGHKALSLLVKRARSLMVPVVASTALSTKISAPDAATLSVLGGPASTASGPLAM